jgi:GT2 family glycosyltransferase
MRGTIAAIVPTYKRGEYLVDTIKGLLSQSRLPDEILVFDQTPPAEHPIAVMDLLRHHHAHGNIDLVTLEQRGGVYPVRNLAARTAKSEILLYLDDDITPSPDLVRNHMRHYTDAGVSGVTGSVVCNAADDMRTVPTRFRKASHLVQAFTYSGYFSEPMRNIGFMYANNFSVRKEVLVRIGGWDEHVLNYGDRDLGIRLCAAGYRIDYDPEAKIVHHTASSGGSRVTDPQNSMKAWERCVSLHYLAWRHLHGWMFVKYGLYRAARFSFLLRRNALRPSVWPQEVAGFARAFFVARRWSKEGVKSPFVAPMAGQ